jgi:hypothetical protein
MTYHAYEIKALSIIREVGKRKEYFLPCREDQSCAFDVGEYARTVDFANQQNSKVIINTEETACFNTSKYLNTVYIDNIA